MFLLNKMKNKNIIVAHVNYHKREDSNYDQEVVENFCQKNNIPLFILEYDSKTHNKDLNNFQAWARKFRYLYFQKIYRENSCNALYIAHHKDDFLETAFLQKQQCKKVNYWGMKKKNFLYGMNIVRPLLFTFWKKRIAKINQKKNIKYAIDSSNEENIYSRNKVRNYLKNKSFLFKFYFFWLFRIKNLFLILKNKKVDFQLKQWKKQNWDIAFLQKQPNQKSLIFNFIHSHYPDVELSDKKIEGILQFLFAKERTGNFNLGKNQKIIKKKYKILVDY